MTLTRRRMEMLIAIKKISKVSLLNSATPKEVAIELNVVSVRNELRKLDEAGYVSCPYHGNYVLTQKGEKTLREHVVVGG